MRQEAGLGHLRAFGRKSRLAAEILRLYVWVLYARRRRSLPAVVAALRADSPEAARPLSDPIAPYRLAWGVQRVVGRLPTDSRCLVRSLVLVGLLARRSVVSTLVIGVSPGSKFAAHAWVELEGQQLLPAGESRYERLTEL